RPKHREPVGDVYHLHWFVAAAGKRLRRARGRARGAGAVRELTTHRQPDDLAGSPLPPEDEAAALRNHPTKPGLKLARSQSICRSLATACAGPVPTPWLTASTAS